MKIRSPFVSRNGKYDRIIMQSGNWGARDEEGILWNTIIRIACEYGEVLREYKLLPKESPMELLKQCGLIDS